MNKLVSVMMPVYNGLSQIKASLESLKRQTYENWECIIVDDGSNDGTSQYLDSIVSDKFVVYHFTKNMGRPYARQKALELASGEYIAMLDADDLIHPYKLEMQVQILDKNPNVYLVASGICSFGKSCDFIRIRCKGDNHIHKFSIDERFPVAHACSMLRREWAINFEYNPLLSLGQDIDFLRRYLNGKEYVCLDKILYYYSELDSVSKAKIMKAYKLYFIKFFKAKEYLNSIEYIIKYISSFFIFPFVKTQNILKSRGTSPTFEEFEEYNKYCKSILLEY